MSAIANSRNFSEICCPIWFGKVPEITQADPSPKGDWGTVSLLKKDPYGHYCSSSYSPKEFVYTIEQSTGDLYGVQHLEKMPDGNMRPTVDSRAIVACKSAAIFIGTPFYLFGMIFVNTVKIAVDISAIFWRTLPQVVSDLQHKGGLAAIGNMTVDIIWNIPHEVLQDIWRVVRSPMYAAGMMLASAYGVVQPFEGRKWMAKIELNWHQGVTYRQDLRYGRNESVYLNLPFTDVVKEIWSGKVHYLGYCMQKRGNINDKVLGFAKFRVYEKEPKKARVIADSLPDGGTHYTFEVEYNGNTQSVEVEKREEIAWPKRFHLFLAEMPNEACIKQFAEDVKQALGTDQFPAGTVDQFLKDPMTTRVTIGAAHSTKDSKEGKLHLLKVEYNRVIQKIEIVEKTNGTLQVTSCDLQPNQFPTLHAKQRFIRDLRKVVGEKDLWVMSKDRHVLQKTFQDGQMGHFANIKYQ